MAGARRAGVVELDEERKAAIEFLLRRALAETGRLPSRTAEMRRPGRPSRGSPPG